MINIQPILTRKRVTFSNTKEVYKYERDSSEEEADTDDNMKSDDDEEYESYDDEKDDALYQDGYYDYE
uniref:Uncharacterized protein n=1 Tax=Panagrolaimus sp. PS1159 TaxID=55785 RepID=A0AC35G8C9_9BILA